jgi:predicted PurR-regulated permease PerM
MSGADGTASGRSLAARATVVLGIALLAALLAGFFWFVSHGVLVVFTAVVVAVVLDGLTGVICRYTRLHRALGMAVAVLLITAGLTALLWTAGVRMAGQAPELRASLEQSVGDLERRLRQMGIGPEVFGGSADSGSLIEGTVARLLTSRASVSETLRALADVLVIIVAGIYFAAQPRLYTETVVKLFPVQRRNRLRQVLRALAKALRHWMAGRMAAMVAVGTMTTIGMLLLDVRLAVLLGFIAGILTFIPYLGAIISLIPAVLIALLSGPATALYVTLLFFGAHLLEGYILTPLIQEETVHLAPGWLIVGQAFGFLLAGVFGMAMATPVAVVVTVVVQMLYVQDVLGDHVRLLGN